MPATKTPSHYKDSLITEVKSFKTSVPGRRGRRRRRRKRRRGGRRKKVESGKGRKRFGRISDFQLARYRHERPGNSYIKLFTAVVFKLLQ